MSDKKFIPVILGTGRTGRRSELAARYVVEALKERADVETELIDVLEYTHGHTIAVWQNDPVTKPWQDIVKRASAFIIVFPEYNHGYPGELKMLLDQDYDNYKDKKVLLCGVSSGGFGGVRGVENLLPVCRELGMITLKASIYFSKVEETFKQSKAELDKLYLESINKAVDLLIDKK
jgi:NAD(P)H-dependent FMN reductase